jgi:hypothetical protein
MKLAIVLLALATLPLALPAASAAHQGACWHEYVEGAAWALGQTSPVKAYSAVVESCNHRAMEQVCYLAMGNEECVAS